MEWYVVAILAFSGLLLLLAVGLPIGLAMGISGLVGLLIARGPVMLLTIPTIIHETVDNFVFIAIPLFILLGALIEAGGFSGDLYTAAEKWAGRLPGGLGVGTIGALAWFAAVSGSTVATAAAMGKVALPQMLHRGYDKPLAAGIIIGGSIGALIPPSIIMILYGVMTEVSVGHMFMAGYGPGLLLVLMFSLYLMLRGWLNPKVAPKGPSTTWRERFIALKGVVPFLAIMLLITGSIYTGVATPTEAAATAVVIALAVTVLYGRFTLRTAGAALMEALTITGFIVLLVTGAKIFSFFLAMQGVAQELTTLLVNLLPHPMMLIAGMMLLYLILGMLMDPLGMMVLTIPVFFPVLIGLGVNPILFGILLVIQVELAVITPPVGITTYVIASVAEPYGVSVTECFRGILPFAAMMIIAIALVLTFPPIALWLPGTMLTR